MNAGLALCVLAAGLSGSQTPTHCPPAAPPWTVELDAEALLWFTKTAPVPPLATTSAPADLGVLGAPSTVALFTNKSDSPNPRLGGRYAARGFLDNTVGLEFGGFFLENGGQITPSGTLPVVAIPTIDPASGVPTSVRIAAPGAATGFAALSLSNRFWGTEANAIYRADAGDFRIDVFGGFRFLQLTESLGLKTSTTIAGPGLFAGQVAPAGSSIEGFDSFGTRNSFYGGQVGARLSTWLGETIFVQASGQIAVGSTNQRLGIAGGSTLATLAGPRVSAPGGVFAQTTNIGRYHHDSLSYVPQVGLLVGYMVRENVRVSVGYDFLYWSDVARPGDQIDRTVNPNLVPLQDDGTRLGASRPSPRMETTGFWAQGLTFGVEVRF